MFYRQALVLAHAGIHEVEQGQPLTIRIGFNLRIGNVGIEDRIGDGAGGAAKSFAQVWTSKIGANVLDGAEEKHFVLYDRPAKRSAKLIAIEVLERFSIGGVGG